MTRALSIEEIHEIVHAFGVAAVACKRAGVDVIEIHGHVGYLLDQFMTPLWNRRGDEYGAQNFENNVLIYSGRRKKNDEMYEELVQAIPSVIKIGDCDKIDNIKGAIMAANMAVRKIQ